MIKQLKKFGKFIDSGRGVLSGHDTIGSIFGKKNGISRLADKFNIIRGAEGNAAANGYDVGYTWSYSSTKVKISKKGFLAQFPWKLGPVGTVLNIPFTHTLANAAKGNTWIEFENPNIGIYQYGKSLDPKTLPVDTNHNYYLTTWNNTAMIQTGHSNGQSTEDERKVLANTLFYLKQITHKKDILDNSGEDLENPTKVDLAEMVFNSDNSTSIKFRRPEDKGSKYEYYVKGLDGLREFTSDKKSAEIKTGVKKYKYAITEGTEEVKENKWKEISSKGEQEDINLGEITFGSNPKFINIVAVDGAGNESEIYKKKLEVLSEQEIEVEKDVLNKKEEYKIGDIVKYNIKVKIKENETNKRKIENVKLEDIFPEEYLEYDQDSLKTKGKDINVTKENGKIKMLTNLKYGETKEISYVMKVKENANGKTIINNVTATGESVFTKNVKNGNASKSIKVNDPRLDIKKGIDKKEYKVRRSSYKYS